MHLHEVIWTSLQRAAAWWLILRDIFGALWVQNLILALSAGIGIWTLGASSLQERRRATVDVLLGALDEKEFKETRRTVKALVRAGLDIPRLLSDDGIQDRRVVLSLLTRYEYMASGLRERAFDAKIYKRMYYSTVIGDWDELEAYVRALREDRGIPTLFQELEKLVINWKKHPLKAYYKLPQKAPQNLRAAAPPTVAGTAVPLGLAPTNMPAPDRESGRGGLNVSLDGRLW